MPLTLDSVVYVIAAHQTGSAVYMADDHSDLDKNLLRLKSSAPKTTPTSYGNRRSESTLIDTVKVNTPQGESIDRDMKLGVSGSIPVGADFTAFQALCAKQASLLTNVQYVKSIFERGALVL